LTYIPRFVIRENPGKKRRLKAAAFSADTFMRWSVTTRLKGNGGSEKLQGEGISLPCAITPWNAMTLTNGSVC
jgi:hypothetical protein